MSMPLAVQRLDALAKRLHVRFDPLPVYGESVVRPAQRTPLVEEGEEQLTPEPVVVAHPIARDRKAQDTVEEDRVLHVAREGEPAARELGGAAIGREIHAQLFERVHPVRQPLADHEGVERQFAMAVPAVVDEVPHDVRVDGQRGGTDERLCVGGKVEAQGRRARRRGPPEPRRLAIAEDRAEVVGGPGGQS